VATGRLGEEIAAAYLELCGYRIIDRNLRLSRLEIDLVARRGQLVCLVEVRLRRRSAYGAAIETIDARKRRHLRDAARLYLARSPARHCRFDVVAIDWSPAGELRLLHVVNALA
jgi:putative endonuclease